jgi:hypothetical protein
MLGSVEGEINGNNGGKYKFSYHIMKFKKKYSTASNLKISQTEILFNIM